MKIVYFTWNIPIYFLLPQLQPETNFPISHFVFFNRCFKNIYRIQLRSEIRAKWKNRVHSVNFPPSRKKFEFKFFSFVWVSEEDRTVPAFTKKISNHLQIISHLLSLAFNQFPIARINRMELDASSKCGKQDYRATIEVEACCIGQHISLLRVANCKRGCWSSWNTVVSRRLLLEARQGEQRILVNFHQ